MDVFDGSRFESVAGLESSGAGCRGFAGVFRLAHGDRGRMPLPGVLDAGPALRPLPALALWSGPSALRLRSTDRRRQLVVTGGGRQGAALVRASQVLSATLDALALVELGGGLGCAFALHDDIDGTLVLGRDAAGVMPLYVAIRSDRIAFATELGSFASLLGERPEANPAVLAMFLDHGFSGDKRTALCGIERLMPGELIEVDRELRIRRRSVTVSRYGSALISDFYSARRQFDALFEPTIAAMVDPQRPCGLLLSGGLDSALICSALSRTADAPVQTLAVGYDFTQARDELAAARRIAELFATRHRELRLGREALWRHIPWMVWRTDELMDDPAALPTSLASAAFSSDCTIFTGEGADDVFAGDGAYRRKAFQRCFANILVPGTGGWRTHGLWKTAQVAAILGEHLLEPGASKRADLIAGWTATSREHSWLRRAQTIELDTVFPNTLAVKVGRNLNDTEASVRMPFVDPAIVRFGLSLADRLKVRGRMGKYFLREWASAHLPRDHVMQRKRGFHAPIGHLLRDEYLDRLEPALMASAVVAQWFKPAGVARLFSDQRTNGRSAEALWRLLHLAIWYSLFVLRPGVAPTPDEDPLARIL